MFHIATSQSVKIGGFVTQKKTLSKKTMASIVTAVILSRENQNVFCAAIISTINTKIARATVRIVAKAIPQ